MSDITAMSVDIFRCIKHISGDGVMKKKKKKKKRKTEKKRGGRRQKRR